MGLNICVYKPVKHEENVDEDDVHIITGHEEFYTEKFMEQFGKYLYKKEIETYSMDALKEHYGIEKGEDWEIKSCSGGGEDGTRMTIENSSTGERKEVFYMNKWDVIEEVDVIDAIEVGYQRKGANNKFYEDEMEDSPCVCDKETLEMHQKLYFTKNIPDIKGEWCRDTEYDLTDEQMKSEFENNIISKFIEGETYVLYC